MQEYLADLFADAMHRFDPSGLGATEPVDERDAMATLLAIHDLWLAPLPTADGRERFQNHPEISALKWRLEATFLARLEEWVADDPVSSVDAASAMRRIARRSDDSVYEWLAGSADWDQLVTFLAIEGGPDGGFDDLVALCQVGIRGEAKVVFGANYWDEMGRGALPEVHTVLHDRLVAAVDLPRIPHDELPLSALYRSALNGLLATNRWLQPEMIGALGLLELQAGPRCRKVLQALERLGAPDDAFPFYAEHARADPLHGKAWLDGGVRPLIDQHPSWGSRIVNGARWRAVVNDRLFTDVHNLLARRQLQTA